MSKMKTICYVYTEESEPCEEGTKHKIDLLAINDVSTNEEISTKELLRLFTGIRKKLILSGHLDEGTKGISVRRGDVA